MKLQPVICLTIAVLALALHGLRAAEPTVNPTGTWRVTTSSSNNPTVEPGARPSSGLNAQTLKLKLSGGTLTGTLTYNSSAVVNGKPRVSEAPMSAAKLDGNEISFNFGHPPSHGKGPNADYTYRGKITGDTIKGTATMRWMDHTPLKLWEANRLKE